MRTISMRQFRNSIATIDETVSVQRRGPDGDYQIIGTWYPTSDPIYTNKVGDPPNVPLTPHIWSPAPKPTRRK